MVSFVSIRKQLADVAHRSRTQDRVCDGMQQNIRVAVTNGVSIVSDVDATKTKRPAACQPMGIVANSNPLVRRLISLFQIVLDR